MINIDKRANSHTFDFTDLIEVPEQPKRKNKISTKISKKSSEYEEDTPLFNKGDF